MKTTKTSKILAALYSSMLRDKFRTKNSLLAGPLTNVGLTFNSGVDGAYTTLTGKTKSNLRIVLGGKMVQKIAELPDSFSDEAKFKSYFNDIIKAFYGLDYHEMGHVLFTAMTNMEIAGYPEAKYRGFLHQLMNILEDPIVEMNMILLFKDKYPYDVSPKIFFDFMIEKIFIPQCSSYKDHGDIASFMNYMLLSLRCGKSKLAETNKVFDKYSTDLMRLIGDVYHEGDPDKRIHKVVVLGEWIIENITEFDWSVLDEPPEEKKTTGKPGGPGMPGPKTGKGGDVSSDGRIEPGMPSSSDGEEGEGGDDSGSSDGESEDEKEEEEESEGTSGRKDIEESVDDFEELDDVFNDVIHDGDDHQWVVAKDEYYIKDDTLVDKLNEQIEKYIDCINDVSKFLQLFKGRIKPRVLEGFTSGRLNIRRAMQDELRNGCDTKLFNRSIKKGQDADLAVSLLCDNSGSMCGEKSHLCSQAALALAQACDWADIPFECNCFTKTCDSMTGTCITITEKSFSDKFENAKPFFAINDSKLINKLGCDRCIPTFCGNSEEINLYYLWKRFARVDHKTKLLFVFCDGMTTGSSEELKTVVRKIEQEDGIIVIGIGICCSEVARVYPHSKIFESTEELETGLAPYLVDTLSHYAR